MRAVAEILRCRSAFLLWSMVEGELGMLLTLSGFAAGVGLWTVLSAAAPTAALIPGGNDTLLLSSLPSLSLSAGGAYAAMLLAIAAVLRIQQALGLPAPELRCSPSGCVES